MMKCACGCGGTLKRRRPSRQTRYLMNHDKKRSYPDFVVDRRGCWIWQHGKTTAGYASMGGGKGYAHRAYFEFIYGRIPEGLMIDHLCRVRHCVNPSHMEAVTNAVNSQRGSKAKLTPRQVRKIRGLDESVKWVAKKYGVSVTAIRNLLKRKRWANV